MGSNVHWQTFKHDVKHQKFGNISIAIVKCQCQNLKASVKCQNMTILKRANIQCQHLKKDNVQCQNLVYQGPHIMAHIRIISGLAHNTFNVPFWLLSLQHYSQICQSVSCLWASSELALHFRLLSPDSGQRILPNLICTHSYNIFLSERRFGRHNWRGGQ